MQPKRVLSIWWAAALLVFAIGCVKEVPDDDDDLPFVPDKATWGRNKTRVDEEKAPAKGPLMAGVAVRMIDGPVGASMAGYGGRGGGRQTHWNDMLKGTAGFYGMQSIKAIVVSVGDERMAFVKSPLMSSESYLTDAIIRQLKENYDLDFRGRVITVAGHSHHTTARYWPLPQLLGAVGADTFDAEIAETNAGIFADAIAAAWDARVPAEWAHGHLDDWDPNDEVYRDRRREDNELGYGKDPRLTMMAFRRKSDASPLAVVFNFPIHGTAFGADNDMFTEDAPGYVEHKFEEYFFARTGKPVFGLYAQSAGGSASPGGDGMGHPTLARMERLGQAAAPKMFGVYESLQWSGADTELAVRSQRIEIVHHRVYEGRPWENEFSGENGEPYEWGGWQCSGEKDAVSMEGGIKYCIDLETFLHLLDTDVPTDTAHQAYLTMARLGDLWMMTMPGEPAWSIVKYARDEAAKRTFNGKPANLMVLGYAQDHLLYLTAPDDWYLGGYESEMSLWGPGGGVFLADEQLKMMDAMIAGKNGPAFFQESPPLSPVPEFEPRVRERSLAPGEVVVQPAANVTRTETVQFAANCGDPALGSPLVRVQRQSAETFTDVPALHGWPGHAYDNSRYEMVSAYDPDPPQVRSRTEPERTHTWRFYWQVPSEWPGGTYRMHLQCSILRTGDATTPEVLSIHSTPFVVHGWPEGSTVDANLEGRNLTVAFRVPGVEQEMTDTLSPGRGKWASAGYRLLDAEVRPDQPALVRAALKMELLGNGGSVLATADLPFDGEARANVATLASDPPAAVEAMRVWLASDHIPAKFTVPVTF